jgi:hypothetical protein
MNVHCFTSFTYAYLSRARVLARTLRHFHPEWTLWALVVDEPPDGFNAATGLAVFDRVAGIGDLGIERPLAWLFKHDVVEACTAVKGHMLRRLLELGAELVVYLDPDIALFGRLDETLAKGSILLTPHQLEANTTAAAIRDNEFASLLYGTFNLGFLGVRNDANGRGFADWWAERLHAACYDEPEHGLFTDQRYCDLAPALFDGVHVIRDPGCNVASWNLSRRALRFTRDGTLLVNDSPLKFYHFTKIGGVGDFMTERYGGGATEVLEVWTWYKRSEVAMRLPGIPDSYWYFATYSDGTPIENATRRLYRSRPDLMQAFDNPFDQMPGWLAGNEGQRT